MDTAFLDAVFPLVPAYPGHECCQPIQASILLFSKPFGERVHQKQSQEAHKYQDQLSVLSFLLCPIWVVAHNVTTIIDVCLFDEQVVFYLLKRSERNRTFPLTCFIRRILTPGM